MGARALSSGDEIVFGEIHYREPVPQRRPDRDPRLACIACQTPGPADLPIFLDHQAARLIERHAQGDPKVELGGVLLGKECVDEVSGEPFVRITQSLPAKHYASTQASFTYTHDSWEEITRERDQRFPDLDLVGWYHTHPGFGIFLSHHDQFIHRHFFSQPLQVAYVVDPVQTTRGFFQWRDGELVQVGGFYLCAPRKERVELARLAEELEQGPGRWESGGGGIPPRLEAELIAMLNRPMSSSSGSAADRLQIAATFGLLGSLLGLLLMGGVVWLYQLQARVHEQSEAIAAVGQAVERIAASHRLALDTLMEQADGATSFQLVDRYNRAAGERDEARRSLAIQRSITESLGSQAKELQGRVDALSAQLEAVRLKEEQLAAEAANAAQLRKRVSELEQLASQQRSELEESAKIVESMEGRKAAELLHRLQWYRYATLAAGGLSLVLAVGMSFVYFTQRPRFSAVTGTPLPPERGVASRP